MKLPLFEISTAIYQILNSALLIDVYGHVPDNSLYPYVVVDEATADDWSTKTEPGTEVVLTINGFSNYKGTKEIKQILSDITETITSATITLNGFTVVTQELEYARNWQDNDIHRGVTRFKFQIEEV
jgi:hypothetical protein